MERSPWRPLKRNQEADGSDGGRAHPWPSVQVGNNRVALLTPVIRMWTAVAVALLLSIVQPSAQTRIEVILSGVNGPGCVPGPEGMPLGSCNRRPGALLEIDVESASVVSQTAFPEQPAIPRVVVTADGRYVLWSSRDERTPPGESAVVLLYRDRVTGQIVRAFRKPSFMMTDNSEAGLVGHPTQLRAYAEVGGPRLEVSSDGIRETTEAPDAIAPDGSAAVINRQVVDLATGAARCALPTAFLNKSVFSRDGSTGFTTRGTGAPTYSTVLSRFDARTCVVQRERDISFASSNTLWLDPATGRLFLHGAALLGGMPVPVTAAFDPDSLMLIGTVPHPPGGTNLRMVFDGHRPRAYRLFVESITGPGPFDNRVDIIDTEALTVLAAGALPSDLRATDMAVVPAPPPPSDVRGSVAGGQVTVEWRAGAGPGLATAYRLEAGSAPGLADIATFQQSASVFVASGVPPRTYFVRVRALNNGGAGPASSELVITVP
jgi:hypothetical protein